MRKGLALFLLFLPALAQVGLRDGPRPSTEVRGYLEGNAQEGYRVRVEFYLETGANPTQGTSYQSLTWNGRLYLCVGGCDTFSLQGFTPGTYPNGQAYNLYDSQGRLRGKAGVTTVYSGTQPQQYRVDYAVWPLSGTKTWQASPDNPVPLETGGWLTARPPGGSPERYRYPGMESYQPPSRGSLFAGISPADRDLAQKSLIDSLAKLRAFLGRQPRNGEAWFFVPEVTPWTLQLAQEFQARVGGPVRFVVPEGTATSYCSTNYRNDTRFYVLPRPSLDKKDALAVIWPPQNASQKGAAMTGRYLVDRPDWPDGPNCLGQTLNLAPTTSGLPEARAYLYGCISQANLKARVEFKETSLGPVGYVGYRTYGGNWDGKDSFDLGNGQETIRLSVKGVSTNTWIRVEPALDAQDRNRGYAQVYKQGTVSVDTSQAETATTPWYINQYPPNSYLHNGESLTIRDCRFTRLIGINDSGFDEITYIYEAVCQIYDTAGRWRGTTVSEYRYTYQFVDWGDRLYSYIRDYRWKHNLTVYPLRETIQRYYVYWYLSHWQTTWRAATDNDRPVEAGGYVTAEGRRYRIPGLEEYLMPQGREIEAVEGDPYVTYITRSLLPDRNPYGGLNREEAKTWYKPLSQWCRERGL